MKIVYETFDGRLFNSQMDARAHEEELIELISDTFDDSGLTPYLQSLDDEVQDKWYGTDRSHSSDVIWRLFEWCVRNGKTLKLDDGG